MREDTPLTNGEFPVRSALGRHGNEGINIDPPIPLCISFFHSTPLGGVATGDLFAASDATFVARHPITRRPQAINGSRWPDHRIGIGEI